MTHKQKPHTYLNSYKVSMGLLYNLAQTITLSTSRASLSITKGKNVIIAIWTKLY